jgi:hypothetical protein
MPFPMAHTIEDVKRRRRLFPGWLAVVMVVALAGVAPAGAAPQAAAFGFPEPDMTSQIVKDIVFPVDGTVRWTDTYGACRDGCSRRHEGQDLLGAKLTKLVATVSGTIVELRHRAEGNSLYLRGDDGWYYAYLHINNDTPGTDDGRNPFSWAFAPGMATGVRVSRGQHIAYMGDSGNAEATAPHLHFEIRKPASAWYNAQAINPKYSLDAAGRVSPPPTSKYVPWTDATTLIQQQGVDFFGRPFEAGALAMYRVSLEQNYQTPQTFMAALLTSPKTQNTAGAVARMYPSFLGTSANPYYFFYWAGQVQSGRSLASVADSFAATPEFRNVYGGLSDGAFVDLAYRNLFARAPSASERGYWTDQLWRGMARSTAMLAWSDSAEYRWRQGAITNVTVAWAMMLRRVPTSSELGPWIWNLNSGQTTYPALTDALRRTSEYRDRFF